MLQSSLAGPARPQPSPDKSIIDQLAEDMVDLTAAEGCATRDRLLERGWGDIELASYETEARQRARALMNRAETSPAASRAHRIASAAREIGHLMPTMQQVVMHLQNRRFSKPELDDILADAIAKAGDNFAHAGGAS
ncbi:hypothetical protein [Pelagibacterium limicola]|uniref:hypothetical protein n=1 Tax=Pelagibacterium limicola TaxID=2791022 RepID=UPI0018AFC560|nr:hypothetical protein [Pelagibacterium limicola]